MKFQGKDKTVAILLAIFGGGLGLHRFYLGSVGMGIVYLFTGGLFGIGWLVDIIKIAVQKDWGAAPAVTAAPAAPVRSAAPTQQTGTTREYEIMGLFAHKQNLMQIGKQNRDWDLTDAQLVEKYAGQRKRVFRYYFSGDINVQLIPEPQNPHDPNCVGVYANGLRIGAVPAGDSVDVKKLLPHVVATKIDIKGGEFKLIENGYVEVNSFDYRGSVILALG